MDIPKESMAISKFKATCLAVLERVRRTGQSVRITRFGVPVADIVPPAPDAEAESWLGAMCERGRVVGDLVAPVAAESEWEVLSERAGRPKPKRRRSSRRGTTEGESPSR